MRHRRASFGTPCLNSHARGALFFPRRTCHSLMASDCSMRTNGGGPDGGNSASCSPCNISYTLPIISSNKLPDQRFVSRGAYGTVSSARHADWRIPVAVKSLQGSLLER